MKPHRWAAALLLTMAMPAYAAPELYRWIAADGSVRYTPNPNQVPSARRDTLVPVEPGMAPPPPTVPAGTETPVAIHAPPGEPDADPFSAPAPPRRALAPAAAEEGPSVDAGPPDPVASEAPVAAAAAAAEPAAESHAAVASPPTRSAGSARVASPSRAAAAASAPSQELRSRREELVAQIAEDEETLKALISAARTDAGDPLIDSATLREIARRLPVLQEELRALDEQSARLEQR